MQRKPIEFENAFSEDEKARIQESWKRVHQLHDLVASNRVDLAILRGQLRTNQVQLRDTWSAYKRMHATTDARVKLYRAARDEEQRRNGVK